jgi:hypothetical protein
LSAIDVDLVHDEVDGIGDRSWEAFYPRTRLVRLGETDVRVLGLEDHLRVLCIHMLKGPRMSPVLLCDIALMIETLPARFDWNACLGSRPQSDWVASAIGLAHQLLDVSIAHTPVQGRAGNLPRWLVPAILKQWATYRPMEYMPPMTAYLRNSKGVVAALRTRWPNPFESTLVLKKPLRRMPPVHYQLGYFFYLRKGLITQLLSASRR